MPRFAGFVWVLIGWASLGAGSELSAAPPVARGYQADVKVTAATRLDWIFAVANQSPPAAPADWLPDYDSTKQAYERFVPRQYQERKGAPLVIFVSPSPRAMGWQAWQ